MTTILNPSNPSLSPPPRPGSHGVTIRDLLNTAFFYRRMALVIWEVIVFLGIVAVLLIPPSYTARARLLTLSGGVYEQQPGNPNDARVVAPPIAVDVEMQLLESPELHRAALRRLGGPELTGDAFDQRLTTFENHLHVSKLETGNVIELTYRDRDPQQAAAALRALLRSYFDERVRVLTSGRVEFLSGQNGKVQAQLDAVNGQIEAYEKAHGVVDIAEQITGAVTLDGTLRQRLTEADAAVAEAGRSSAVLAQDARGVPRQVELFSDNTESTHTLGVMQADLFRLQAKRADLASRYMAGSPFVRQIDAQIALLEGSMREEQKHMVPASRTGYNTYRDTVTDRLSQAQAALAGAEGRRSVLTGQMAASEARLKELIGINDALARLTNQRDMLAATAKDYAQQLEQAQTQQNLAESSGLTNVRVIEQPEPPRKRTNPPWLFLVATALAGLLVVAVVLVVASSLRETFLTPEEAERALELPVLCDVAARNRVGGPVPRNYGRLVAALDSVETAGPGKSIALLCSQREGKVATLANGLAEALEPRAPGRVLLVHMTEDVEDTLDGLAAAPPPEGKAIALRMGMNMSRSRLQSLFNNLRTRYEYIVVTAPPAAAWFESLELTTVADLSVLVINAETTRKPVAQAVLAQSAYLGGVIEGLAMTGRRYYIPAWVYRLMMGRASA